VQPHAEFIERQRQPNAVDGRGDIDEFSLGLEKQEVCADSAEQENSVIQMVDMVAFDVQIQVGDGAGHDEDHQDPGRDEGHQKRRQRPAGDAIGHARRLGSAGPFLAGSLGRRISL